MFRQAAHASSIELGLLMLLNLPGWHLQGRKCVWKRILTDCFANDFEKFFKTIASKETCNLFLISPTIAFLPPSLRGRA
jgi:hypothetical protein